jgi:hypothetical protein
MSHSPQTRILEEEERSVGDMAGYRAMKKNRTMNVTLSYCGIVLVVECKVAAVLVKNDLVSLVL